ncbi:unnamed protein product [Notodromas monacha]|uniref:Receptor expression-enhancing protein n=1 Tax=Notodromas monacha TaxID=399045 RepID=A0A7R9BMA6_9CRUS|nr:unnamed protein product [Notodromas monacha]CAG0918134.1 unnamed protein product [Notodromas monacha]
MMQQRRSVGIAFMSWSHARVFVRANLILKNNLLFFSAFFIFLVCCRVLFVNPLARFDMEVYRQKLEALLKEKNAVTDLLVIVEQKTGAPRLYVALGSLVFIVLWLVYGYGAQLVCNLIGFVYPAYMSVKALESRSKEDDTKWLTYWVVFAVFSLVEFFSDILLSWFPVYWLVKCGFLIWCYAPISGNGSTVIYKSLIRPFFLKHESKIHDLVNEGEKRVKEAFSGDKSD